MSLPRSIAIVAILSACRDEEPPQRLPPPTFTVDANLSPASPFLPGPADTQRPVAAVSDPYGVAADFVEQELLLLTDSESELEAFLARWDGELLQTVDPNAQVDGHAPAVTVALPLIHHVRIDASLADPSALGRELQQLDAGSRGAHRVSSDLGLATLAAAAHEAAQGHVVGVDYLFVGAAFADRDLADAPTGEGGYTPNAFDWFYMRNGSPLDTGVVEAWRDLDQRGKLTPSSVSVAVLDGGFVGGHAEWPPGATIDSTIPFVPDSTAPGLANTMTCGGGPCPWHGTAVTEAGFGLVDNGIAAAGPGGPVARPHMYSTLGDMITGVAAVTRAAGSGARVINMSYTVPIPGVLGFSNGPFEATTGAIRDAGVLLFAAAGNDGADVDRKDCFLVCWEVTAVSPCENKGVHCVGGTHSFAPTREGSSAYGQDGETDATVDIAGPFEVFGIRASPDAADPTGTDPRNPAPTRAFFVAGTSFSSPFVAGVAALIWAADPSASTNRVEELLFTTAHPLPGTGLKRLVDAQAAVLAALEDEPVDHTGTTDTDTTTTTDCDLVGTWSGPVPGGPFAGQTNDWTVARNGTTSSAIGVASLSGTWTLDGSTLTVTDTGSIPAYIACPAGQEGTYEVDFPGGCDTLRLTELDEPCAGRRFALDGFEAARQ